MCLGFGNFFFLPEISKKLRSGACRNQVFSLIFEYLRKEKKIPNPRHIFLSFIKIYLCAENQVIRRLFTRLGARQKFPNFGQKAWFLSNGTESGHKKCDVTESSLRPFK